MAKTSASDSNLNLSNLDSSSASIDNRRAQQLVERAMALAERGDLPAAVLACRQSIALAPTSSQGFSMLGLLLERAGDSAGAIAAYEKVLQLAPDSLLERESLGRLRVTAAQRRTTRDLFVFDDTELFDDERPEDLPSAATSQTARAGSTPIVNISDGTSHSDSVSQSVLNASAAQTVTDAFKAPPSKPLALSPLVVPGSPAVGTAPSTQAAIAAKAQAIDVLAIASSAAAQASTQPAANAGKRAATVATTATASKASMPFPSTMPVPGKNAGAARLPQAVPANSERLKASNLWEKLRNHPSFYFRGVPLAATSVVSLAFLFWAHGQAASRSQAQVSPAYNDGPMMSRSPINNSPFNPSNANPGTGANGAVAPGTTTPGSVATTAANTGTPTAKFPGSRTAASRPVAGVTGSTPADTAAVPAPAGGATVAGSTPMAGGEGTAAGDGSGYDNLPKPRLGEPAVADDTVRISDSPNSTPVAGNGENTDYVRVAPSNTVRPVARPESAAAGDERAAGSSARSGDSSAALARMTRSIESGGDTAFRYQQRAQLQLQNGDANSAINDYQSAIAAYNDMIARGERVNNARAGIAACQRGIQIAQARR